MEESELIENEKCCKCCCKKIYWYRGFTYYMIFANIYGLFAEVYYLFTGKYRLKDELDERWVNIIWTTIVNMNLVLLP